MEALPGLNPISCRLGSFRELLTDQFQQSVVHGQHADDLFVPVTNHQQFGIQFQNFS